MANIPQSSVEDTMDIGIVGQLADFQSNADATVDTATSEESSAAIPFGVFVQQGSADDGALLLTGGSNRLKGIVVHSHSFERRTELSDAGLDPLATFAVLTRGRVYVTANDDVAVTDEVHVCHTVDTNFAVGLAGPSPNAANTIDITAFARWIKGGLKGEVVVLEIDMNNVALASADT